jgi:hypothetical protein
VTAWRPDGRDWPSVAKPRREPPGQRRGGYPVETAPTYTTVIQMSTTEPVPKSLRGSSVMRSINFRMAAFGVAGEQGVLVGRTAPDRDRSDYFVFHASHDGLNIVRTGTCTLIQAEQSG